MTREYRYGDPLRRVHWAVTARQGKLMVRAEESVTTPEAAMVLDQRRLAFGESSSFAFHTAFPTGHAHGTAAAQPMRTTAAFEKAVVAAASIATHLLERGYAVRVLDHRAGRALPPPLRRLTRPKRISAARRACLTWPRPWPRWSFRMPRTTPVGRVPLIRPPPQASAGTGAPTVLSPRPAAFDDGLAASCTRAGGAGRLWPWPGLLSADEARLLAGMAESTQSAYAILLCHDPAEATGHWRSCVGPAGRPRR